MPHDNNDAPRFDPRFDPVFQRGYAADSTASPSTSAKSGDHPAAVEVAAPGWREVRPVAAVPSEAESESDDVAELWGAWIRSPAVSARRWLNTLWWIGAVLLALGVACLAYGIWADNDTAGQQYQDFWITVYSAIAWNAYGPTMTIGLITLVATGVVQLLAPGLREER
ncbi:hypothetical protein ACX9R5_01700 [Rathayibacter sp. CAU 1779]